MPPDLLTNSKWDWVRLAIESHQADLIRYAHSILGDQGRAQDCVQDTFIKLCKQKRDKVEDHLLPWLFRVLRNHCLNTLRKEKRMSPLNELESEQIPDSTTPDPRRAETVQSLFEMVDTLPARQRECVLLKFQQDFSYQEIADITGLTVSNVGYILHQAVKALKSQWEILQGKEQTL